MSEEDPAVGIDVGGTNIKAVCVSAEGLELARATVSTPGSRAPMIDSVRKLLHAFEKHSPRWIGISSPGLAARDGSRIVWMQGRMEAVQGLDWSEALSMSERGWVPFLATFSRYISRARPYFTRWRPSMDSVPS